ncbi:hypothetical protein [Polaribacter sp.]|uniref:hypothetical protein n=1 Tax=Polaribacter sp. TaxID=1920175 RepID=UPI0040485B39
MKTLFLFLGILVSSATIAQEFNKKDIKGMWKRSDGLIITISGVGTFEEGGNALVFGVGDSGWSQTCVKRCFKFREIQYEGGNEWISNNKMYMPTVDYTKNDRTVTIKMADDKKSFTASRYTQYKN